MNGFTFDTKEFLTRILKYLIMGLTIGLVAVLLPSRSMTFQEVVLLALIAASIFALLDLTLPAVASSAQFGVGAGAGLALMGVL